jgi:hypothetical protein
MAVASRCKELDPSNSQGNSDDGGAEPVNSTFRAQVIAGCARNLRLDQTRVVLPVDMSRVRGAGHR